MNIDMQDRIWRTLIIILMLCAVAASSWADEATPRPETWATPVGDPALKNFYKVDDHLYRSAQPDPDGMKQLEKRGIVNILNLRQFHTDTDEAEGTSLCLSHVSMNAARIKDEDIIAALKIIQAADKPVLVHCWHGSDRTGAVVAMYRILFQGWTKKAAIDEMVGGGYGHHAIYSNIAKYIEAVDLDAMRQELGMDTKDGKQKE